MTDVIRDQDGLIETIISYGHKFLDLLEATPHSLIALAARFGVGAVFLQSGVNKVANCGFPFLDCQLTSSALFLFKNEFKLPLLSPELAATLATVGEHVLPVMLFLGLGARLGALGLLVMTFVIQTFVYPDAWPTHLVWAVSLIYVAARGPGVFSVDHFLGRAFNR